MRYARTSAAYFGLVTMAVGVAALAVGLGVALAAIAPGLGVFIIGLLTMGLAIGAERRALDADKELESDDEFDAPLDPVAHLGAGI